MPELTSVSAAADDWGPADWKAVAGGALVLLWLVGWLLWKLTDPAVWSDVRETFRKPPPSDPRNLVPYKPPAKRS